MKGFFTEDEIAQDFAMQEIKSEHPLCEKCGMYRGCQNPRLEYTGQGRKKCLIVAEANGADEDERGKQLIGEAGQFFRQKLKDLGMSLDRDFWKINACNCRPLSKDGQSNRTPTRTEIQCCRPMVERTVRELKPEFIWILGGVAVQSFYMEEFKDCTISRWRRLCIPDSRYDAWITPMFHPSYAMRMKSDDTLQAVYDSDLKWAASTLERRPYEHDDLNERVSILTDLGDIVNTLESVLVDESNTLFLDFETSGLKPQARGHKIASISFTTDVDELAYSFPFQYANHFTRNEQAYIKKLMRDILSNPRIRVVAHNIKFEDSWSRFILGVPISNKHWCTMLHAHVRDCRKKWTSLKFQSYINFGMYPYDKQIKRYLQDKSGTGFNSIDDAPLDKLLKYGAYDAWLLRLLYDKQVRTLPLSPNLQEKNRLASAYSFFHRGNNAFCDIQSSGISIDEEHYEKTDGELTEKIQTILKRLLQSKEAQDFQQQYGKTVDISSPKDLTKLFTQVLQIALPLTDKGNPRLDEKVLLRLDHDFARDVIRYRKLEKIKGTYLAEFKREVTNGKMYPLADLNIPVSYRSSMSKPNFQNIPVRDKEAKQVCRSGIIPSRGNQILENDYSGIEVAVAACYTEDPMLVKYVTDPSTDMHRDAAADIWMLPTEDVTSDIRFYGKNCWVFPQFYGSYYGSCAPELWENVIEADLTTKRGDHVIDHMQDHGISRLEEFIEHCQDVENKFWNERFKIYKRWKETIQGEYQRKLYYETFFGFRYTGYLTYNQLCNYPIQGTAFHILLWVLTRLNDERKRDGWKSKILGQIHDSIVWDVDPDEVDHIIDRTLQIGTVDIVKENPWIIVPLKIDFEISPVNGSWYEKEEIKWDTQTEA